MPVRVAAAFLVGCGGASHTDVDGGQTDAGTAVPSGTASGTVTGVALKVADVAALNIPQPGGSGANAPIIGAQVTMSSVDGVCSAATANETQPGSTTLTIQLYQTDANEDYVAPTPGTYIVGQPAASATFASASFVEDNAQCEVLTTHEAEAAGGSIVVTAIHMTTGGAVEATYNLAFSSTDMLSGTFTAPFCDAPMTGVQATCQ